MAEGDTRRAESNAAPNEDDPSARRLKSPGEAYEELRTDFHHWSGSLTTYSIYAVYAVIGANWAIHSKTETILSNPYAMWSMIIAVGYVAIDLAFSGWMAELYRRRCKYANHDRERWKREYAKNGDRGNPWPHTKIIQVLGAVLRAFHVLGPMASGALLILSMNPPF